jgi:benzoyl-CoA reductase/2-hydroxyglutaryl-CoA dehydratase subunit BcrC/BadD/HgdB
MWYGNITWGSSLEILMRIEPVMTDAPQKADLKRKLRSVGSAGELMREHYRELGEASSCEERKIAWCASTGPAELLRGMGFLVYFPENHAAMLAARRRSGDVMTAAERLGYSPDICSYLRSDIGAFVSDRTELADLLPGTASVPRADVLVYNTGQCRDIKDWFSWYGNRFGVPCVGVEGHCSVDAVTADHVRSISAQLRALVPRLEAITGTRLKPEALSLAVERSRACSRAWGRVLDRAARRPSPLSFFNGLLLMGPAVVARGTDAAVRLYESTVEELDARIAHGVGAVRQETHRLFWEGMPVWGRISELTRLFSSLGACVVASTYCHSWVFEALDPADPFDSMARAYTELFIVRSDAAKEAYLERMISQFSIDGIVFLDAKTCPSNTNSRYGMPERLTRRLGVPSTPIYGDHSDLGAYNGERVATQVEAFIEQLEGRGE